MHFLSSFDFEFPNKFRHMQTTCHVTNTVACRGDKVKLHALISALTEGSCQLHDPAGLPP